MLSLRVPDHDENAASLANLAEIIFPCLDAVGARSVLEIGVYHGKSTRALLDWAIARKAEFIAVDPEPEPEMLEFERANPELRLVHDISHRALPRLERPDALIIDGDHNYFTLSEELRMIEERSPGAQMPLVMLHDLGWPLARRDSYYAPERIPEEHRQPLAHDVFVEPGNPGLAPSGLPFACAAVREGGPRNGTLTAVEDFIHERPGFRLAIVPAFFGFGVLWHTEAPWSGDVAHVVDPWDGDPVLARMEENRVAHMVERYRVAQRLQVSVEEWTRQEERAHLLRVMLGSRAFALGERLSALRKGGRPAFSRAEIRAALGDLNGNGPAA